MDYYILTEKQKAIYEFMVANQKLKPPNYREIAANFGITTRGAYEHVDALIKKGYVKSHGDRKRGEIEVIIK